MKQSKMQMLFVSSVVFLCCALAKIAHAQTIAEIQELCNNLTPANEAIARRAGYDIDQLCNDLQNPIDPKIAIPQPELIARDTISTTGDISDKVAPVAVSGVADLAPASELKPFGYDLFANAPTTYAPAASIPVSGDYLLGPGDTLDILFYGKINSALSLEINREGYIDFPELGPVGLAGLTYGEAKEMLQARIAAQIIGTQVSISMGALRSMQIFVLGEAFKPGAYTVSSLSTITNALVSSGGISDIGSLRNIQLKRKGNVIANLDLYDLLLSGDTSKDVRVQAADVIYVPTVGDLVSVDGQILRPAIYELKGGETVGDLVELAGGLGPKAFSISSRLERINDDGFMTVVDLDLNNLQSNNLLLKSGDHLVVDAITDYKKDIVSISGAVRHAGDFFWREGMKLSNIISNRNKLSPDADLDVALLIRELENTADIEVITFDLGDILSKNIASNDLQLESRDKVIILSKYQNRATAVAPYLDNLKRQASIDVLPRVVSSGGEVRFPGEYPLSKGMTVRDLIALSGGLTEAAYSKSAEIFRMDFSDSDEAASKIFISDLSLSTSPTLEPLDYVEFRTIPNYREAKTITLEGEFVFPGVYFFQEGEQLTSVIERAGGFTDQAFIGGSIFLREQLKEREQQEIDRLLGLLNEEVQAENLRASNAQIQIDQGVVATQLGAIEALSNSVATGRLVVPLQDIMYGRSDDVVLKNGDKLLIPKISQEVTILGEVRRPTSYIYNSDFSKEDYINQSGGFKDGADKSNIYIVKASGEVMTPKSGLFNSSLFRFDSSDDSISPGDTIVVPLDTDDTKIRGIPLISEVSTIIYQLSLGAAAVRSFTNN